MLQQIITNYKSRKAEQAYLRTEFHARREQWLAHLQSEETRRANDRFMVAVSLACAGASLIVYYISTLYTH